ncbi:MAG: SCO family protein [Phycisphaerales bacterium JB037]
MIAAPLHPARRYAGPFQRTLVAGVAALAGLGATPASGQVIMDEVPEIARGVGIEEQVGSRLPESVTLRDADGGVVDLADYFSDGKPAVISLVYYDCPLICPLILERLIQGVTGIKYRVGKDFNLIVVSFDPTNTDEMARDARATAMQRYELALPDGEKMTDQIRAGFKYHTASQGNVQKLADAVGFKFKALPNGEFSHPDAMIFITPGMKVARYLPGLDVDKRNVELALAEAAEGKLTRSVIEWFVHTCFVWDPNSGAYTLQAMRVMQIAAALTTVIVGAFIGTLLVRDRLRGRRKARPAAQPDARPIAHPTGQTP